MLKRTQEEIVAKVKEVDPDNPFEYMFTGADLISYLDFGYAAQFFEGNEKFDPSTWKAEPQDPVDMIVDYLPFAWNKANNLRGLSANRSIYHMHAWIWLAGDEEALSYVYNWDNYAYYGKPMLEKISEFYGVDWVALDDGMRTNGEE